MIARSPEISPTSARRIREAGTVQKAVPAFVLPPYLLLSACLLLGLSGSGCSSSAELETIDTRLADLQLQMLQLQKQGPTKAEIRQLDTDLQDRIGALVETDADLGASLEDLILQVERLQAKIEEASHELGRLSQQISATNDELQAVRIAAEEARRSRAPSPAPRSGTGEDEDPQTLYDRAYSYYTSGNYDLAILDFRQYLESHPETDLADNATYWLGECYYHRGKFERAIDFFDSVLDDYSRSDREVSARLKRAYAHLELGQRDEGVEQLREVACRHDGTDEAKLASKRLEELGFDVDCQSAL